LGDEQPPDWRGVMPDADDPSHDEPRTQALWGNLMGGGSGVEWYFGHKYPHMDINCEDFRSRDHMWDQTRYALDFFRRHLPFFDMEPDNDRVSGAKDARLLARADDVIAVYLPAGGEASVRLGSGRYSVRWYNPRTGGELVSRPALTGPGVKPLGQPPHDPDSDWAVLIKKM
ncbi:MAG TPA: putative collagen-binding domain-containing protein, partial [Bryobacteraceae bacterium]|nr:putative collagen-binding domain-containing protein [Bryobacteraceae bacterium]